MTTTTDASLALFLDLARDMGNWSGTPLVTASPAQRGNLTDLKQKGLLTTFDDDGCKFAEFTAAGFDLAKANGVDLDFWRA
tara:strand:- start:38014 stop:38256 length:243 start_codon:yes stop_codon:yes gene_type:complete